MSDNISYVSSALSTSLVTGSSIAELQAAGATKYGDIFKELGVEALHQYMPSCGQNCFISCSCNTNNGWFAKKPTSGSYVTATTTRKYALTDTTSTASTFAATSSSSPSTQTCYKSMGCPSGYFEEKPDSSHFRYTSSSVNGKTCYQVTDCQSGHVYTTTDYFHHGSSLDSDVGSYQLAITNNNCSLPSAYTYNGEMCIPYTTQTVYLGTDSYDATGKKMNIYIQCPTNLNPIHMDLTGGIEMMNDDEFSVSQSKKDVTCNGSPQYIGEAYAKKYGVEIRGKIEDVFTHSSIDNTNSGWASYFRCVGSNLYLVENELDTKLPSSCDYPYFKLTEKNTGTQFFNYIASASVSGGQELMNGLACTETASCKNGVNASGVAEVYGTTIINRISSDSKSCVDSQGVTKYETVCTGSASSCGNKKTLSTCESFDYIALNRHSFPVLGTKYYTCGDCDTSNGYYSSSNACQTATGSSQCVKSKECYYNKCRGGYYDTLAKCEQGKPAGSVCKEAKETCYTRVIPGYFKVVLDKSNTQTVTSHYGNGASCDTRGRTYSELLRFFLKVNGSTIHPTYPVLDTIEAQAFDGQEIEICTAIENDCVSGTGSGSGGACKYLYHSDIKVYQSDKSYVGGTQNGSEASPWWACLTGSTNSLCTYKFDDGQCSGPRCSCFKIKVNRGITYTIAPACYIGNGYS